ncbi:IPT/TIG domain-containing protein [Candidatus Nomurabacteria bacterium]|nr:IPT/TIG domain-containing protein [Candidatus Nomurabacteria bacterium]
MLKKLLATFLPLSIIFFWRAEQVFAQATDGFGVNDLVNSNLGTRDVVGIVNSLINIFLGFLGIIAVILIIYGGWLWMTSQGSAEQIQKAKLLITSAVIGLIIIMSSYLIARFVISKIVDATGAGGGEGGSVVIIPPPVTIPTCPEPMDGDEVKICKVRPDADSAPVGQYITIEGWHFDAYGANSAVKFDSFSADLVSCGGIVRWQEIDPVHYPGYFRVKAIVPNIALGDYKINVFSNDGWNGSYPEGPVDFFEVVAGTPGPGIACLVPNVQERGLAIDIQGIGFSSAGTITMTGWDGNNQVDLDFDDFDSWSDTLINNAIIPISALSSDLTVTVSGLTSGPEWLQVYCGDASFCASGCCAANSCVDASACFTAAILEEGGPIIDRISPEQGAEGNIITVYGRNFGDNPGSVVFENNVGGEVSGLNPADVNAECTQYWSDEMIVVVVPDNLRDSEAKVWVRDQDGNDSNFKFFDDSFGSLPSLCRLEPLSGSFEDLITLYGIKFNVGDKASFGGVLDHDTVILSDEKAETKVPNLEAGELALVLQTASGDKGNALPFTAEDQAGGDPVINQISPDNGPKGQYLTIFGANFGNAIGTVTFKRGGVDTLGDFSFPAQCSDSYWSNSSIVVKVPSSLSAANDYQIVVKRSSDGKISNQKQFAVVLGTAGPGLCSLQPDNGPANDSFAINLAGDNFGNSSDVVRFFDNQTANINTWENQYINARVPLNAQTGPVVVENDGVVSNALNFEVGSCSVDSDCGAGYECCFQGTGNYCALAGSCPGAQSCEYSWTLTTVADPFGLKKTYQCENNLQSPSPWPDALDGEESRSAYLDANVAALFTRDVLDSDINSTNVRVQACNFGGEFDPSACSGLLVGDLSIINHDSDQEGFVFNPAANLDPNRWYVVKLGVFHSQLGFDIWDGNSFDWHFRTQDTTCQVTSIQVTPTLSPQADLYLGDSKFFYATPQGSNCNVCGSNYNWEDWELPVPIDNSRANIIFQETANVNISRALLEGLQVTENSPVPTVELQATLSALQGSAYPKVKDAILKILDYGPNCNQSCVNASIWAIFNTELNPGTLNTSNISIRECADATCGALVGANLIDEILISASGKRIDILHQDFDPETSYLVQISSGVKNISGYNLAPAFKWSFTTSNANNCRADSVRVEPDDYFSNVLGEDIAYYSLPYSSPNVCSAIGQPLDPGDYEWNWTAIPASLAIVHQAGTYQSTVTTAANGEGQISAEITTAPSPVEVGKSGFGNLEINEGSGSLDLAPQVLSALPHTPACINSALMIQFNQKMNHPSLESSVKLFERSNTDTGSCLFVPGDFGFVSPWDRFKQLVFNTANAQASPTFYWCPVTGEMSINNLSGGTRVILYPDDDLLPSHQYLGVVYPSAMGINGQLLDPSQINYDYNHDSTNDFYAWQFTTTNQVCQVSFVTVEPDPDLFTCARNDCFDDLENAIPGNQHKYQTAAYDASGNILTMDTYQWSENKGLLTLLSDSGNSILATAVNDNGTTNLTVEASDDASGTAIGSAQVDLFICENPWPRPSAGFPYKFNGSAYNFSTYYCQDSGRPNEALLPYLALDPSHLIIKGVSPDGMTLEEFIFIVDPQVVALNNNFDKQNRTWWSNLLSRFKNKVLAAIPIPASPSNLELTSNDGQGVRISWLDNSTNEDGFKVYRKSSSVDWREIAATEANQNSFIDTSIIAEEVYNYKVLAYNDGGQSEFSDSITVTAAVSSLDVIGVRVMKNEEHLSVQDWYQRYAPNSGVSGQELLIDGYQALRVGNTVYIAAANASGAIYTNIYVISYNIGARESTRNIFEAMVQNMKLSTNVASQNICLADPTRSCESRFDCLDLPNITCDADGLDLRRDTERLGELVSIQKKLDLYGQIYKACSNNSAISCSEDDQCPSGGSCVLYYPLLNSGTYANGMSVSKWPSWQEEFAQTLGLSSLPTDPINDFPACPEGFDSETCWNATDQIFTCPIGSSIYFYKNEGGSSYSLEANFEFSALGLDFVHNLANGADSHLSFDAPHCSASFIGLPISSPDCGNGIPDPDEDCDGGFRNLCDANLGEHPWWNEHLGGCYPKGTVDAFGNLVECTWYEPSPSLNAAQCGNYCGDGSINSSYEFCEGSDFGGLEYACADGGSVTCNTCIPSCSDGSLASIISCGDGIVQGSEDCEIATYLSPAPADSSVNNQYQCSLSCQNNIGGYCGDGLEQEIFGETCDNSGTPCTTDDGYAGTQGCVDCQQSDLCVATESCGDGIRNGSEACDGADLGGLSCLDYGWDTGNLACDGSCQINQSDCSNLAGPPVPAATIFLSSLGYQADYPTAVENYLAGPSGLSGIAAADYICQWHADNAPADSNLRDGVWKAWVSDQTHAATDRLVHNTSPYILPGGTVVASNWSNFIGVGPHANNVNMTENAVNVDNNIFKVDDLAQRISSSFCLSEGCYFKSNTYYDGSILSPSTLACNNYTSTSGSMSPGEGHTGLYSDSCGPVGNCWEDWSGGASSTARCDYYMPLLCLWQQSDEAEFTE